MKKLLRWIGAVAMLSTALTGCALFPEEETFPVAPTVQSYEVQEYDFATVLRGDLFVTDTVRCDYVPAKIENLSFGLDDEHIENIYVTQGQQVKAGDLLAELAQEDLKEKIQSQEYQINLLAIKIKHLKEDWKLQSSKYDSKLNAILEELETIRTQITLLAQWQAGEIEEKPTDMTMDALHRREAELVAQRDARRGEVGMNEAYMQQLQSLEDSVYIENLYLEELKQDLKARQIVAGIDGTVTYISKVKEGQLSEAGSLFITVSDMTTTAFTVEGNDAAYFPVGTETTIEIGGTEHTAVSVEASVLGMEEQEKATAYLMLEQPDPLLESGDRGRITVVLDSRINVLYVTKKAIQTANDRQFVYVLNEDGLKVMQDVTVGLVSGKNIEIVSGLSEGDSVVLE